MLPWIFRRYLAYTGELKCRHCGSDNVRLSKSLNRRSFFHIYRCSACGRHFKAGLKPDKAGSYVFVVAVMVILVAMLVTIVYLSFAEDEAPVSDLALDIPTQLN